jgi:pimeloyl-ACP methyl ester carboxylesterase
VLVGHSIGGLYMPVFAKTHPEDVAGVVLADPTYPDQFGRMKTERPSNYRIVRAATALNGATTQGAEMRGIVDTQKQWHAAGQFPSVPMILLSASRDTALNGRAFTHFFQGLQRELAAEWPGAELRMVNSDHFVQRHRSEDVVRAIEDVIAKR